MFGYKGREIPTQAPQNPPCGFPATGSSNLDSRAEHRQAMLWSPARGAYERKPLLGRRKRKGAGRRFASPSHGRAALYTHKNVIKLGF